MARVMLFARVSLLALGLCGSGSIPSVVAQIIPQRPTASKGTVTPVDARSYNHCHNMPRRVRCHRKARLPANWPPNTNTPARSRNDEAALNRRPVSSLTASTHTR